MSTFKHIYNEKLKAIAEASVIDTLKKITDTHGMKPLKFKDGQISVDVQTANKILRTLDIYRAEKGRAAAKKIEDMINNATKQQFNRFLKKTKIIK